VNLIYALREWLLGNKDEKRLIHSKKDLKALFSRGDRYLLKSDNNSEKWKKN
jgi:hypothetical protein